MKDAIRSFIIETFFVESFKDDDSFLENGILDSTGILELTSFLQAEYGIQLDDDDFVPENLDSLNRVCAFVERKSADMKHRQNQS